MSLAVGLGIGFAAAGAIAGPAVKFAVDFVQAFTNGRFDDSNYLKYAFIGAVLGGASGYGVGTLIESPDTDLNISNQITLEECIAGTPEGKTPSFVSDGNIVTCSYE